MIYEKYSIITYGFLIIGCTYNISPVINTVDLTSKDFSNSKNLKEVKACEFFLELLVLSGMHKYLKQFKKIALKRNM